MTHILHYPKSLQDAISEAEKVDVRIPPELKLHLAGGPRSLQKLWAIECPVTALSMVQLMHWLKLPFWSRNPEHILDFDLCPIDVIRHRHFYVKEYERVRNAGLTYPMDIIGDGNGNYKVIDGLHRLTRMFELGSVTIRVRIHTEDVMDRIRS